MLSADHERQGKRQRVLTLYFVLVCAISWTLYYVAATAGGAAGTLVFYLGVFTPGLVALAWAWSERRGAGVKSLIAPLFHVNVPLRWYVFAISYMAAAKVLTAMVFRGAYGYWPPFGSGPWLLLPVVIVLATLTFGQAGEELGWRGHALPRLASRFGLRAASIIVGFVWAVWHLPLFFWFPQADTYLQSFPTYTVGVVAMSVAMTWLYARTRGSLMLMMLMHSAINQSIGMVSSAVPGATDVFALSSSRVAWITAGLLWVFALFALVTMQKASDSNRPRV
jgi:membrane protease YdiL (CAAX protease family)